MPAAIKDNQIEDVPDNAIDVELTSPTRLVGSHANLVPLFSNAQPTRLFYGTRFFSQSMPLVSREAPLVQSLDPESSNSFEKIMGEKMGARFFRSDKDGEVMDVTDDGIDIKLADGTRTTVNLYHNFQFNRKSQLSNKPLVKPGDKVRPGQLLASSNFTDDNGIMAMGVNARIAMTPYKGYSMDDAIVVSDSFARRLTSEHSSEYDLQKDQDVKTGINHFVSLFPTRFTKEQLANMDANGVVRPGTVLRKGDPMILATRPKTVSSNTAHLGKLSRLLRGVRADSSEVWDHDYPGVVTDVADGKKRAKVFVRAEVPMAVGDKITLRNGQKCYHPDTEIFTEQGWVGIADLKPGVKVAALFDRLMDAPVPAGVTKVSMPQDLYAKFVDPLCYMNYDYDGNLYGMNGDKVAYLVTPNHRVWCCADRKGGRFTSEDAAAVHGCRRRFMVGVPFELDAAPCPEYFVPPNPDADPCHPISFLPFMHFFGCYMISKASCIIEAGFGGCVTIWDTPNVSLHGLEDSLDQAGFRWCREKKAYQIQIPLRLAHWLLRLRHHGYNRVPDLLFQYPLEAMEAFLQCLPVEKRHSHRLGYPLYRTQNEGLAEDIARLLLLTGKPCRVHNTGGTCTVLLFSDDPIRSLDYRKRDAYYRKPYCGKVYCLQVPGLGVLLTRYHGKIVWNGNSIGAKIIPDSHMLRSEDGTPFEVLLNPLALPSRVNAATLMELALGKIAAKKGEPAVEPAFTSPGTSKYQEVLDRLREEGLTSTERVFDPEANRYLENPVSAGIGFVMKLHHVVASKKSARGQGSYTVDEQPAKGGGEAAKAKRLGGLENTALMSRGAYGMMRDAATIRGQKNDDYWRLLRQGYNPAPPGAPFVFDKFRALLNGAGYNARDLGGGKLRLAPFTQRDLDEKKPIELKNGKLVDPSTLEPVSGGLFDPALVGGDKWGSISLPVPMPNPAFEKTIQKLLGITNAQLRAVLAGEKTLKEVQEAAR